MKVLYLPIFEPGAYHGRSVANKHGLRRAFEAHADVMEWDYLATPGPARYAELRARLAQFRPDLVFMQVGPDTFSGGQIRALRREHPHTVWVNWNGDYWPEHLTSPSALDLGRALDMQLVVNGGVLADYAAAGVRAAFWPFGYEPVDESALPPMPSHDVVFLGNNYSDSRTALYEVLRGLNANVGIYGNGWPQGEGETTYDFAAGAALYRNAKVAISDAQWPDATGYLSNRSFEALAAGVLVFQQRVDQIEELLGLRDGEHWVLYNTPDELPALVAKWLDPADADQREAIAAAGKAFVRHYHSWERRVAHLLDELWPTLEGMR